jgi:hypothetical protein
VLPNQRSEEPTTENHEESQKKSWNKQVKNVKILQTIPNKHPMKYQVNFCPAIGNTKVTFVCYQLHLVLFWSVSYLKLHSVALSLYTLILLKKHLNGSDKYLPPINFYWPVNFLHPKETLPMKAAIFFFTGTIILGLPSCKYFGKYCSLCRIYN